MPWNLKYQVGSVMLNRSVPQLVIDALSSISRTDLKPELPADVIQLVMNVRCESDSDS